ncbi:MAG: DUF2281 domain-containing protein [Myxococcota bacterium]|nr:DUF2281 domain-containing protein [Myxococcota bacterium]
MTPWELVVEKLRELPPEKQQEVLDFVEFVRARRAVSAVAGCLPGSVFELVARLPPGTRTKEDVDRQLEEERAAWGDR